MIGIILRKELVCHIITARVFIFFTISTGLFVVSGLTFVRSHESDVEAYSARQAKNWTNRNTTGTSVVRKPNPLGFCVEGDSHIRPRVLHIKLDGTIRAEERSRYENFRLPDVRRIDWGFIVQIIYALFCVVLTFDAISGERERDTLRLVASNAVSRVQILLGKYLAVLVITFTALLVGSLISLIIINMLSATILTSDDFAPLMLFMLLSMLHASLFISMSLLASSLARRSATSLLSLLFIVILLVFMIPNMTGIIAEKLVKRSSDYETRALSDSAWFEYLGTLREIRERIQDGTLKDKDEIARFCRETEFRLYEARRQIRKEYENGLMRKQTMAETLALISPSGAFQAAGESLVNSGGILQKRLRKVAELYQGAYLNYVRSKVGEIIPHQQPGMSISLSDNTVLNIPEVKPKAYDGDMSDFPLFVYPRPSLQERLQDSFFSIALLLLWNVVCFMGMHIIFVRQDMK